MMKRTRLRKASKKRQAQLRIYYQERKVFLSKYRFCECTCPNHLNCLRHSHDIHHMKGRGGEFLLNQTFWIAVCRPCHQWIEENKREARALGLIQYA